MSIQDTLANEDWLKSNEENVKLLFPASFTEIQMLDGVKIGLELKKLGVEWRSEKEFEMIMMFFQKLGFILREGKAIKRNPTRMF